MVIPEQAIYINEYYGPNFGGNSLKAAQPFNGSNLSYSWDESTAYIINDTNRKSLLTGLEYFFTTVEIEVFAVVA